MNEIRKFVETLEKPILIYGLGKSGSFAANALAQAGAKIVIGDDNVEAYQNFDHENISNLDADLEDLSGFRYLMLSPGIPLTHPEPHEIVKKAQASDLEILCDIELFARIHPDVKTIGVTGTNGKSTTSALINHLINESGKKALFGGNIGTAIFDLDIEKKKPDWVVLEMSSFQIDLCPTYRPDIAVILNLTPDHIDRHGSMENYADVKERLTELRAGTNGGTAIICTDDEYTQKIYSRVSELALRDVVEVSTDKTLSNGVYVTEDIVYDAEDGAPKTVGDLSKIQTLKGLHNHQNAACAYAAVKAAGLKPSDIWGAMESFPGLNHRQFLVRTINGVGYVNDSKSTNAASAAVALACQKNVYWIVGGRRKKTGLDGLEHFFPHLKHAFLIGESTEDFANWFDQYGMEYTRCFQLENAVEKAHKMAQENKGQPGGTGVVLLSPACASFDHYKSFEERGTHFAEIVNALPEEQHHLYVFKGHLLMTGVTQPQAFSRMDQSFLGAWWWTVDRALLASVLCLMFFGVALVASASPSVAKTIGVDDFHFLKKHLIFLVPSLVLLIGLSMLSAKQVWRFASVALVGTVFLMFMVLFLGDEVKGARRWISLLGFSVQPSEFIKPTFAVVAAWLIALHKNSIQNMDSVHTKPVKGGTLPVFQGYNVTVGLYFFLITLLLLQPDLGMTVVLTAVFAVQVFLAGLRFRYLAILLGLGAGGLTTAYFSFHHVRSRIDRFFNPESGDNYQVERSLDAIRQGGFAGVGPGQGTEKMSIPDAHADFIFSVLIEEMGVLFAIIMMGIFLFIMLRGFRRLQEIQDVFSVLAAGGLLAMFGFQSLIHIGSSVNLIPAKGMTLPFVSYGGSSMLSMAMAMGFVLALTRQKKRGSIARSSLSMRRSSPADSGEHVNG